MYTYKLYYYVCIQAGEGGTQTQAGQEEKEASSWRAYVGSEFVEGVQTQAGQGEKEAPPEIDSAEGGGGRGGLGRRVRGGRTWRLVVMNTIIMKRRERLPGPSLTGRSLLTQ